jgi:hypothetical protein
MDMISPDVSLEYCTSSATTGWPSKSARCRIHEKKDEGPLGVCGRLSARPRVVMRHKILSAT